MGNSCSRAAKSIPCDDDMPTVAGVAVDVFGPTDPFDSESQYEWRVSQGMNINVMLEQGFRLHSPIGHDGHVWMQRPKKITC